MHASPTRRPSALLSALLPVALCVMCARAAPAGTAPALHVSGSRFALSVDGVPFLNGSVGFFRADGHQFDTSDGSLALAGQKDGVKGGDRLGSYTATQQTWKANSSGHSFGAEYRVSLSCGASLA